MTVQSKDHAIRVLATRNKELRRQNELNRLNKGKLDRANGELRRKNEDLKQLQTKYEKVARKIDKLEVEKNEAIERNTLYNNLRKTLLTFLRGEKSGGEKSGEQRSKRDIGGKASYAPPDSSARR